MFKSSQSGMYIPSKSQAFKPDVVSDVLPNDEMRLLIPSFAGFIDPNQSFLRAVVALEGGRGMIVPSPDAGAHSLFRNVIIRDGSNMTQIESIEDYNTLLNLTRPFQEQSTIDHVRQMTEGVQQTHTHGNTLYYGAQADLTGSSSASPVQTARTFNTPEVYLRLETGLFSQSKSIPVAVMQGLRLQIDMEDASRALELISKDGTETSNTAVQGTVIRPDANITGYTRSGAVNEFKTLLTNLPMTATQEGNPFEIGDRIYVATGTDHDSDEEELGVITGFYLDTAKLGIQFLMQTNTAGTISAFTAATSVLYVKQSDRVSASSYFQASDAGNTKTGSLKAPTYKLKDVEFRGMTITPPDSYVNALMKQAMSGKGFEIQICSPELHRVNQNNATGVSQVQIPTLAKMGKSIIVQPLKTNIYRDFTQSSFKGVADNARDYQFQLGNSLVPTRRVALSRYSQGADRSEPLHLTELQKSLINADKDVRTLHRVQDHFAIGRAVSRYRQFSDLSQETISLRIDYDAGASQKVFNCYIFKYIDVAVEKGQVITMS